MLASAFAAPAKVAGLVDAGDPPTPEAPALPVELLVELEPEPEPILDPMDPDPVEPVELGAPEVTVEPSVWLDLGAIFSAALAASALKVSIVRDVFAAGLETRVSGWKISHKFTGSAHALITPTIPA